MKTITRYLVVGANGETRVRSTRRSIGYDEVVFKLLISIPESWGQIVAEVPLELPEVPAELISAERHVENDE